MCGILHILLTYKEPVQWPGRHAGTQCANLLLLAYRSLNTQSAGNVTLPECTRVNIIPYHLPSDARVFWDCPSALKVRGPLVPELHYCLKVQGGNRLSLCSVKTSEEMCIFFASSWHLQSNSPRHLTGGECAKKTEQRRHCLVLCPCLDSSHRLKVWWCATGSKSQTDRWPSQSKFNFGEQSHHAHT